MGEAAAAAAGQPAGSGEAADDEEDAEEAYNILLEIVQNVSTYHNQAGKKAERLLKILKDPTSMNKSVE